MSGILLTQAHNQWANRPQDQRFQTLDDLFASVNSRRMRARTADIPLKDVSAIEKNGKLLLNHGIKEVVPSHWSFGQLSTWVNAPAEYLRRLPASLAVQNINHGIQKSEHGELKFMTIVSQDDSQHNTLQAVTSTTYGRIWDADVVNCAKRIVDRTGGRFYNPKAYDPKKGGVVPSGLYASDRDVFIFMIDGGSMLDAGPRAQLNRGFFLFNSEVGRRKFGLTTFLFNTVCGNHFVWGAQNIHEISIRHTSGGPTRFDTEAMPTLDAYVNASAKTEVDKIKKAQDYLLPFTQDDEIVKWFQTHKFTKTEATESLASAKREEGECRTLWQAIQGVTAYARGFDFIDARVELETKSGKLMELIGV